MHKTRALALLFLAGMLPVGNLYAASATPPPDGGEKVDWQQECRRVKDLQPPKADMPAAQAAEQLAGCNAQNLYHDAKEDPHATRADWEKVRACAFATKDNEVLLMLYANGEGVKFNPDVAIHYACSGEFFDREEEAMISDLLEWKASGESPGSFAACNYATVTPSIGYCTAQAEHQRDRARNRQLDQLARKLPDGQRAAFGDLRKAAWAFAEISARNETDLSGTGRAIFVTEAIAEEKNLFLKDLEQCEREGFPQYDAGRFAELDQRLNAAYRKAMQLKLQKLVGLPTGISKSGIRKVQREWVKYRDAWVAFARLRYPSVPAHAWKAMLTERRIKQIEDLSEGEYPLINEE